LCSVVRASTRYELTFGAEFIINDAEEEGLGDVRKQTATPSSRNRSDLDATERTELAGGVYAAPFRSRLSPASMDGLL